MIERAASEDCAGDVEIQLLLPLMFCDYDYIDVDNNLKIISIVQIYEVGDIEGQADVLVGDDEGKVFLPLSVMIMVMLPAPTKNKRYDDDIVGSH